METNKKIVIPGGAGLVGQNLVAHLKRRGYCNIVVLDKHRPNMQVLRNLHADIVSEYADLAVPGGWEHHFSGAEVVVMLQAQIGGPNLEPFIRNNVNSTVNVLNAIERYQVPYTVHVSSSVVESVASDHYTNTKKEQERLVLDSGIDCVVLRPTLMFGWFDRKHFGWLSRFMQRVPIFPIPGNGRYMRQPLYVGDFCSIVVSSIEKRISGRIYNISGLTKMDYIDIIRNIKIATGAKAFILCIPYSLFYGLLKTYSMFSKDAPFTTDQLKALVAHDAFEVIDWPAIFNVDPTPFAKAIDKTFNDPTYCKVALEF